MSKFLREKIEEEYLSITKKVFAKNPDRFPRDVFTLPRFLWAYAVLLSRSFRLHLDGKAPCHSALSLALNTSVADRIWLLQAVMLPA